MTPLARVRHFVARHRLIDRDTRVVVAVSGGSDSVSLAHLVHELSEAAECQVAGLAHFNHQLRATSDADEQLATSLGARFGWAVAVDREDVAARAKREHRSIEHAARTARHEFFERVRVALGGDVVALGHTRDDQAETFLLRLLRGAGPKGLASMHPRRGAIVRPLLACRRRELQEYLADRRATYAEDESNSDVLIPRNRVRAELVPFLEERFNPAIVDALGDQADLLRETWEWFEQVAENTDFRLAVGESPTGRSDVRILADLPAPVRRFVLWRALAEVSAGRHVSFEHVESALALLRSDGPRSLDLPGYRLERLGPTLVLRRREPSDRRVRREARSNFFEYSLSIPGEVSLPEAGCVLAAETTAQDFDVRTLAGQPNAAAVRRDCLGGLLRVRNRRPGDRFSPVGVGGRKKLQDYFVDKKIERYRRDAVPLVVDRADRIIWVAGFGIDEAFRVTDPAQAVLILRLKLLGGSA